MPLVSVRDLKRHYDIRLTGGLFGRRAKLKAVDGVSFDLKMGETLGLVGESGCGKSTTAKLVLGLIPATSGTVSFDGSAVTAAHDAQWRHMRRRMQMIYQDPLGALDRRLPVSAQIGEPIAVHEPHVPADEREARVGEIMTSVGLRADQAASYPHELSGGQRQRVVIARALALQPDFIVCDEPVSALDVSIQAQVLNLLEDLKERNGFTSLFISHDLKVVRQMSDRVAVMYLGMIVEEGPPEDVFHAPMHPYTQALVSAIPTPSRRGKRERIVLEGDPPNPVNKPSGCPFHPRCPSAMSECREFQPMLASHGSRKVACHLRPAPSAGLIAAE
uniref:ABC transporter ATP-binding protein n=1 Tax=Chelativorans sp. YIM 93263 TaxID=2906648 RepID=UPI002377F5EB|nr:ABC transporter ATP-binding protein [Chelativorans sp. YIM 93263]